MAEQRPYQATTEPIQKKPCIGSGELTRTHLLLKGCQLVLSLVAFVCEEVINQCESCGGLYLFEFISCSALLLTILLLVVYCTPIYSKINVPNFKKIDFVLTAFVAVLFLIASITFVATIEKSDLSNTAAAFGFLASFAFLFELYFMYKDDYLERGQTRKPEVANGRPEVEPLQGPVQENAGVA